MSALEQYRAKIKEFQDYCSKLTPEERFAAEVHDFDATAWHEDAMSQADEMIRKAKSQVALYRQRVGLDAEVTGPSLLVRYMKLDDKLWKPYVRVRVFGDGFETTSDQEVFTMLAALHNDPGLDEGLQKLDKALTEVEAALGE